VAESAIPEDVRRFILTSLPSIPHLEALLMLRRHPQTMWDVPLLARSLYVAEKAADEVLNDLAQAGFVVRDGSGAYRYAPASPEQAAMVDRVADVYARSLLSVTHLIHGSAAQSFADAFKLRKD
jgi:DNA-binding IclR family transcriptional regulator